MKVLAIEQHLVWGCLCSTYPWRTTPVSEWFSSTTSAHHHLFSPSLSATVTRLAFQKQLLTQSLGAKYLLGINTHKGKEKAIVVARRRHFVQCRPNKALSYFAGCSGVGVLHLWLMQAALKDCHRWSGFCNWCWNCSCSWTLAGDSLVADQKFLGRGGSALWMPSLPPSSPHTTQRTSWNGAVVSHGACSEHTTETTLRFLTCELSPLISCCGVKGKMTGRTQRITVCQWGG